MFEVFPSFEAKFSQKVLINVYKSDYNIQKKVKIIVPYWRVIAGEEQMVGNYDMHHKMDFVMYYNNLLSFN
jgi:hypothetical protein